MFTSCLNKTNLDEIPISVKNYLETLISRPYAKDLTMMEQNRLNINPSGLIE